MLRLVAFIRQMSIHSSKLCCLAYNLLCREKHTIAEGSYSSRCTRCMTKIVEKSQGVINDVKAVKSAFEGCACACEKRWCIGDGV